MHMDFPAQATLMTQNQCTVMNRDNDNLQDYPNTPEHNPQEKNNKGGHQGCGANKDFEPRQRQQTTMACWPRHAYGSNADHGNSQGGKEYHHKTPVPVVPQTCQHPLCTLCALVPPPNLWTLCPLVLTPKPAVYFIPVNRSALAEVYIACVNKQVQSTKRVRLLPDWKSEHF